MEKVLKCFKMQKKFKMQHSSLIHPIAISPHSNPCMVTCSQVPQPTCSSKELLELPKANEAGNLTRWHPTKSIGVKNDFDDCICDQVGALKIRIKMWIENWDFYETKWQTIALSLKEKISRPACQTLDDDIDSMRLVRDSCLRINPLFSVTVAMRAEGSNR